jgi:hypothetical protein
VSVVPGCAFGLGIERGVRVSGRQARAGAGRRLDRLVAERELHDVYHRVAVGAPVESVALIADEEAADVTVGCARRGLVGHTLRGSLVGEVTATAPCPVVAPLEAAAAPVGRVSHAYPRA